MKIVILILCLFLPGCASDSHLSEREADVYQDVPHDQRGREGYPEPLIEVDF